eukprot:TRINITY_DN10686_c0_g1_i1.p1 TRINITY_DN10686_c0_g1~~TRINITY_DN10686_c0_g1_i1.p1  ORF type:complete len:274 (+),score=59.28 TRINITY_DN10686_c0_g1_i1:1381-2202(+)
MSNLKDLILYNFREYLNEQLIRAYKCFGNVREDERIGLFLENLPTLYVGDNYVFTTKAGTEIRLEELDQLSMQSMPLCMGFLHQQLRSKHHLRNVGRLQYGLFLKGIGVNLEQALEFWREELGVKGGRNFDKDYSYGIKHTYGMVGKRTSYVPYSCDKIINMTPGEGEYHGCPFRLWDRSVLRSALINRGLSSTDVVQVVEQVSSHNYNLACRLVFDFTHPGNQSEHQQNHPNKYFDESTKFFKEKDESKKNPVDRSNMGTGVLIPTREVVIL